MKQTPTGHGVTPGRRDRRFGQAAATALAAGVAVSLLGAHTAQPAVGETAEFPPGPRLPAPEQPADQPADPERVREILDTYCVACHNETVLTADLALDVLDVANPASAPERWEDVVRKLRTGTMPPGGVPRPDQESYDFVAGWLETEIDRAALAGQADPGTTNPVHRLNRFEYNNAVNELLGLDLDIRHLLPGDETADGSFDNYADALSITTAHMERYMSVARQLTRLAIGLPPRSPGVETFEVPLHIVQDQRQSEELPFGSRGGTAVRYHFPVDGEYLIKIVLRRQYQDYLMGMGWPQQLDLRLDGALVERFSVGGGALDHRPAAASYAGSGEPGSFGSPEWEEYMQLTGDAHLEARVRLEAGPHVVGASFVREQWEPEGLPQPRQRGRVLTNDQIYMDIASVAAIQIGGPYEVTGEVSETPSRRAIFTCRPTPGESEEACAAETLSRIARRAYRRPVDRSETEVLLDFFAEGRMFGGSFDAGIQLALERILVDPEFLFRIYTEPTETGPGGIYGLSDLEIASRLSFFLWSSIPDDELLGLAEAGRLSDPDVYEDQILRMLADPKAADALVGGFASQWLNLRLLPEKLADPVKYPGLRRQPPRGVPPGNGTLRRELDPGGPEHPRAPCRRLHLRQRAARTVLRYPGDLRHPAAARGPAEPGGAGRTPRPRRAHGDHRVPGTAPHPCSVASGSSTTSSERIPRLPRQCGHEPRPGSGRLGAGDS